MKLAPVKTRQISLTLQYAATILVLMVMGMFLLSMMMLFNQAQQNDSYINSFGGIIVHQLAKNSARDLLNNDRDGLLEHLDNLPINEHIISASIYNSEEKRIASVGQIPDIDIDFTKPFYKLGSNFTFEPFISIRSIPIHSDNEIIGYVAIIFSQKLLSDQFKQQIYLIFGTFLFILLLVFLASLYLGRKMSEPIRTLIAAAEDIHSGKIDIITERRHDELGILINAINNMSQGLIRKTQVESMLDKVLTKNVKDKIMDQLDTVHMAGEHVYATVLFADIVGFTSISEKISPEEVQKLLNEYYSYFNACSRFYFGTVDKYIGDCVMVVFGAPKEDSEHQVHAVSCAVLMQRLAQQLNRRRIKEGLYPIELRIGINSGKMMAGLIGSDDRMEYTVVGDAVNLASRLCNEAEGAQTIVEESLYETVNPNYKMTVDSFKMIRVRGKEEPVKIYSVTEIAQKHRTGIDDLIDDILSKHIEY
jgi:adenylate cyclase